MVSMIHCDAKAWQDKEEEKIFEQSSMHFLKELHRFLQVYTAEKNNFHCNLLKISKSLSTIRMGSFRELSKKQNKTHMGQMKTTGTW